MRQCKPTPGVSLLRGGNREMKVLRFGSLLPVLRLELIQQAERKRTFIVRGLYASLLFLMFLSFAADALHLFGEADVLGAIAAMGSGERLLEQVCMLQFLGTYMFLPAMMAGAIAHEKERHSFQLLLATRLTPTEILLQKYVSRLVPMLTFLLLTLPVLGIAYLLGGLESGTVAWSACYLLAHCLQIGAYALLWSTIAQTFVGALIGCYLGYGIYAVGAVVLTTMTDLDVEFVTALVAPFSFMTMTRSPAGIGDVAALLPVVLSTIVFLGMARFFLIRRANPRSRRLVQRFFAWLDRVMVQLNERWARGIVLVKDVASTPGRQPVAWREKKRATLGRPQYVVRLTLVIETVVFLGCLAALMDLTYFDAGEWLAIMLLVLWGCAALTVCVHSVNLFGAERTQRTLDILMSTPLDAREIVRQKMRPLRRILLVFLIPFVTLFLLHAYIEEFVRGNIAAGTVYLGLSLGTVLVYLPLIAWTSCLVGIRVRKRAKAIVTALVLLLVWTLAPIVICIMLDELHPTFSPGEECLYFTPLGVIGQLEFDFDFRDVGELIFAVVNLLVNLTALAIVRGCCMICADRCLRRS